MDVSFEPNASLEEPVGLFSRADGSTDTRVQAESRPLFTHSASSSFLAFLPLSFWRQVLEETNAQQDDYLEAQRAEARTTNASVSKTQKVRDIARYSLDELMKFLGILWFMSLVDKGEYANYWGEQVEDLIFDTPRLSLDSVMSLRRFRDLRAAFSFRRSSSVTPDDLTRDSAVRIRPLLNMLKQTAAKHIDPGRDLAVDEATVAARSKFARHLIAYNPRKPTGKYHFKLYMTCCSSTWIALSYRLHGESTLQDRTEGVIDPNATQSLEQEMEMSKRTRQIVLEITQPFHSSGRIINCDNFYTSVQLLQALKLKGLFCRGTVKRTSKHFPRHIVLADPSAAEKNSNKSKGKKKNRAQAAAVEVCDPNAESVVDDPRPTTAVSSLPIDSVSGSDLLDVDGRSQVRTDPTTPTVQSTHVRGEVRRGDILQAVSEEHEMLAASWCDGNIVTIVSNADASTMSQVTRLVRGKDATVPAPTCIQQYNSNMQGVDRNDQVRARFSTANGHSFKKWHKKLAFAIIDIARVNAYLTRKLCTGASSQSDRDTHRVFVVELIQEMFNGKWRDAPDDGSMLYGDEDYDEDLHYLNRESPHSSAQSPSLLSPSAIPFLSHSSCPDLDSSQVFMDKRRKRMCLVCRFEGRRDTVSTVHCLEHKVSLCKRSYPATNPYGCQSAEWSCWDKFHLWYLPRKIFSVTGAVNRSSAVFKEKVRMQKEAEEAVREYEDLRSSQRTLTYDDLAHEPAQATPALSVAPSTPSFTPATPALSVALSTPSFTHTPTPSIDYV